MGTTLSTIKRYLDQRKWRYRSDEKQQCLVMGVKGKNLQQLGIVIRLSENGRYVQLQAPMLMKLQDHIYKGVLFQTLCHLQYQYKLLRMEYDPTDGELRASVELPLEDTFLTKQQFDRCLNSLVQLVDEVAMPRINAVLATGEDPGQRSAAVDLLEQLPSSMVDLLADLLKQRRQES